jgi:hypothetical protein
MPFAIRRRGGEYVPRVKFNAKEGRAFRVDREQGADGGWENADIDITDTFAFMADFEGAQQGYWNRQTYQEVMAPVTDEPPARPEGKGPDGKATWAVQIKVIVKLARTCGGDVRAFAASSDSVIGALEAVYDKWAKAPERTAGLVPAIRLTRVTAERGKQGKNYVPTFEIVKWVQRPEDLVTEALKGEPPAANGNGNSHADPAEEEGPVPVHGGNGHADDDDFAAVTAADPAGDDAPF